MQKQPASRLLWRSTKLISQAPILRRLSRSVSEHEYELVSEDWGMAALFFVPVSAHTKEGIPELLEMILLTAEVKELIKLNRTVRQEVL